MLDVTVFCYRLGDKVGEGGGEVGEGGGEVGEGGVGGGR